MNLIDEVCLWVKACGLKGRKKEMREKSPLFFFFILQWNASDGFKDHRGLRGECLLHHWVHEAESQSNVPN